MQQFTTTLLLLLALAALSLASASSTHGNILNRRVATAHHRSILQGRMARLPRSSSSTIFNNAQAKRATAWQDCWSSYLSGENDKWQAESMQKLQNGQTPDGGPTLKSPEEVCGVQPDASGSTASAPSSSSSSGQNDDQKEGESKGEQVAQKAKVNAAKSSSSKAKEETKKEQAPQQQQQQQQQSTDEQAQPAQPEQPEKPNQPKKAVQPKQQDGGDNSNNANNSNSGNNNGGANVCKGSPTSLPFSTLIAKAPSKLRAVSSAIQSAAQQYSIEPQLLVGIAMMESTGCGDPNAYSNGGGCMQFTSPASWAAYGPQGKSPLDDSAAMFGAANYLAELCKKHGDDLWSSLREYNGEVQNGGNPDYQKNVYSFMQGNGM